MLLADYLKRPVQGEKNLPPVVPQTKENAVDLPKPVWQQAPPPEVKDSPARSAEQVRENNPQTINDAYKQPGADVVERINNGEDVFKALLDKKYTDSKEDIERQRKASLLGDLANLVGQTVASAKGARQFSPIQSKVPYYNEQLRKLKDWRNDADINYSLSQAKNDFEEKKYQQKLALDKYKMDLQQGQFGERMKLEYEKLAENVKKNKITQEQADKKLAELMRHNKALEKTASYNAESSRISAKAAKEKSKGAGANNYDTIALTDSNGNLFPVKFSKENRGAVISLIRKMKKLSAENPGKYGDAMDDVNLSVDTPDQMGYALTILQSRMPDFPELNKDFYTLIGEGGKSNGNVAPWRKNKNENVAPYKR